MRYKEKGRTIDYASKVNRMILALGRQGFSIACITYEVNQFTHFDAMSECQVYYRLRQRGILLRDFRNGTTPIAASAISKIRIQLWGKSSKKTG